MLFVEDKMDAQPILDRISRLLEAPLSQQSLTEILTALDQLEPQSIPAHTVRQFKTQLQSSYEELTQTYLRAQDAFARAISLSDGVDVVVVDDDRDLCELICLQLIRSGFITKFAHDGGQGLQLIQQCLPKVVLLDYDMPVLNGLAVLKKLKDNPNTAEIAVIMFTAGLQPERIIACREAGALAFIPKGLDHPSMAVIVEQVRALLSQ